MHRFLVTGGSGFIGTHFIEELLRNGRSVLNIDIKPPKIDAHRPFWREVDILDEALLVKTFNELRPTHVVHLAARTDTDGTCLADYEANTTGTQNVLSAIKRNDSIERVIITSSQFVNQYRGTPATDLDFAPHTIYGESKVITEKLTRSAELQCVWTIIRPTNIWGAWHPRYPHEFWRILGKGLYVHPGGKKVVRAYGYVGNVVFQMNRILEAAEPQVSGKVFYVGDQPLDLLDWVNAFSRAQRGSEVRVVPAAALRALARVGDALKRFRLTFPITSSRYESMTTSNEISMSPTFNALGTPPYSLEDGVLETVEWLRRHHPGLVSVRAKEG